MTFEYTLNGISFEWDDRKAAHNLSAHRVTFETACEAFFDPFLVVDERTSVRGEMREAIIAMTANWRLLHVSFVLRSDVVRIISARPATKPERKLYEDQ
jgi:uncharacterized protein